MLRDFQLADWFTLANAFCGTGAVFAAMRFLQEGHRGDLLLGMALIPLAFVFDALDGHVARWRKASSTLGRELDSLADVMLTGAARLSRAVLPGMRAAGYGRIVNIGSIHSLVASPYKSAYVAAKHGLVGLAKVIALETADCDITVNTLCPSYVRTPLVERQIADQARIRGITEDAVVRDVMLKPMPKGAFIDYDELAGTVAFLMSHAARNITGQALAIDGGWTAQ
ncbi:hypothetical protein Xlen_03835 [Xanthomonas campestris pv. leeana]|nr:hypothetical protein Xths_06080 [Xanthomonas campestris pv. thespesiae]OOW76994.1 hypothetical protein Xlen_03835 [Xanthomonas campestris pv. leeana]